MDTWRIPNRTNNMTRGCFFLFFIYVSFLYVLFKESTIITTEKQKAKQIQKFKKKKKTCRNVEENSLPILFDCHSNNTKFSFFSFFLFFQFVLNLHPYLLVPFTIKERGCFPPKLAANEQLQKCFFGYSWYGPLFRLRISFVIKFLTNLFPFLFFAILFLFFLYSLISH